MFCGYIFLLYKLYKFHKIVFIRINLVLGALNLKNKKTIYIIITTALISCLATSIIKDLFYIKNTGIVAKKSHTISEIIKDLSLFDVDEEKMADYACSAIAYAVEDNYTNYYSKDQFESFKSHIFNNFYGIGIVVSVDVTENKILVESVIEGSPAKNSGILPGDYLISVDKIEYDGNNFNKAVNTIRGGKTNKENQKEVIIGIERNKEEIEFVVKKDIIVQDSVSSKIINDDIGYIKITSFNTIDKDSDIEQRDTYDEFLDSLNIIKSQGIKKLIIDLRNNPGGSLDVVLKIADTLLPEGIITYTQDKKGKKLEYKSDKNEINMDIVLLVNENSASASEVLSGALRAYKKAVIVGEKTYGKGIVQTLVPLNDGSGISLTTSKYFSPDGICIHGKGIIPDIVVKSDTKKQISELLYEEDIQLQKAVEILK